MCVYHFEDYLQDENNENNKHRIKALTVRSYRNIDHNLKEQDVNDELATYGDALLKLALCKILFDEKVENITVAKQKYESDKNLVAIVAKKYDLLAYIRFDKDDENIPQDYHDTSCEDKKSTQNKGNDSPYKYIATTVEALLAAIYLDKKENFATIVNIVKEWKALIDKTYMKRGIRDDC